VVAETQQESSESEKEEDTIDLMSILKPSARGTDKQRCHIPKAQKPPLKSKSAPAVILPTSMHEVTKTATGIVLSTVVNTLDDKNRLQTNKQQGKVPPSVPSAQEKRPSNKVSMGNYSTTTDNTRNKKACTDGQSAMIDSDAAATRIPVGLVVEKSNKAAVASSSSQRPDSLVSAPISEAKERVVDVKMPRVLSSKVGIFLLILRILC
jgi:hypothetical protein